MNTLSHDIKAGFDNPVHGSQSIFRQLLKGMSEPCLLQTQRKVKQAPQPLHRASYAIALTLLDHTTNVALTDTLANDEIKFSLRFHTGAVLEKKTGDADFVFCTESERPLLTDLNTGYEAYPDQSCTLIIQSESFNTGMTFKASGPGIEYSRYFQCSALSSALLEQREALSDQFPLGIDIIFTCGDEFFCLPRTTLLQMEKPACM